jgi:hypothetical protein
MYNISLKNGKTVSGLYRREEGELLVLLILPEKIFYSWAGN